MKNCTFVRALVVVAASMLAGADGKSKATKPPPGAKQDELLTVTYDVRNLVQEQSGKAHVQEIDDLVKFIMSAVNPKGWDDRAERGNTLHERNGTKLEVRTTAALHAEIEQLLTALTSMGGEAVDVKGQLYEVDRDSYEKDLLPKLAVSGQAPGKPLAARVGAAAVEQLRKRAALLGSGEARIPSGREASFFSLRKAFTYTTTRPGEIGTGLAGIIMRASVIVSADRREVRMAVTQNVVDLVGIKKRELANPGSGKPDTFEVPDLVDSSTSATVRVMDGEFICVPIHYLPKATKAKNRVLVMIVQPVIYVEEEDRQRRGEPARRQQRAP